MGEFLESIWCVAACAACLGIAVIGVGCGGEGTDERAGLRFEGTEPGDCGDDADNDADGLFDCDDSGCAGASVCSDGGVGGAGGFGGMMGSGGMTGAGGMMGAGGMIGSGGTSGAGGAAGSGDPRGTGGDGGSGGTGGTAGVGGSEPACMTSLLCRSCPTEAVCETNSDCSIGSVCIESGCDDLDGTPIKQCVFVGGDACTSSAMCPEGRECVDVPGEGKRCVKTTPGCDTRYDCVLGFACENGSCVDRRVPCDLDEHCPKNHVCGGRPNSSFCLRIQQECLFNFDCVDLAPRCEDIDGDESKECAGVFDPNQPSSDACVNVDCTDASAPVCEASGARSVTQCGQYGLCLDDTDCVAGFSCVGLWPDERKECVPSGGSCSSFNDCPVQQVCASARDGGAASCQAGFQP